MSRVFIYEHLTGGGTLGTPAASDSLRSEGMAMLRALSADFAAAGHHVDVLLDTASSSSFTQCPDHVALGDVNKHCVLTTDQRDHTFSRLAATADWTIVIAPETGGTLCDFTGQARPTGRLLGLGRELVTLSTSKSATAEWLNRHGVPVPEGIFIGAAQLESAAFKARQELQARRSYDELRAEDNAPFILKPDDGCGSRDVRFAPSLDALLRTLRDSPPPGGWRIERFQQGTPVSVAVLLGPRQHVILPPCRQRLGGATPFSYQGGELIEDARMARRARRRAEQVVTALVADCPRDPPCGWLGIDMILGGDESEFPSNDVLAPGDVVIELNPRLTTSYVGLRAAVSHESLHNLASAMLALAEGQSPELRFHTRRIEFDAGGAVQRADIRGDAANDSSTKDASTTA